MLFLCIVVVLLYITPCNVCARPWISCMIAIRCFISMTIFEVSEPLTGSDSQTQCYIAITDSDSYPLLDLRCHSMPSCILYRYEGNLAMTVLVDASLVLAATLSFIGE